MASSWNVKDVESNSVAKDDIVSQSPAAGASAKAGSSLTVDVSRTKVGDPPRDADASHVRRCDGGAEVAAHYCDVPDDRPGATPRP